MLQKLNFVYRSFHYFAVYLSDFTIAVIRYHNQDNLLETMCDLGLTVSEFMTAEVRHCGRNSRESTSASAHGGGPGEAGAGDGVDGVGET